MADEQTPTPAPAENPAPVNPTAPQGTPAPAPQAEAPKAPERPAWLPEKFKDPEQLAQAYEALEKRLGKATEPKAPEAPKPEPAKAPTPDQELAIVQAALDPQEIEFEYLDNKGKLSEATYKKAEAKGLTREFVDAFAAGRAAVADAQAAELFASVGGKEHFEVLAAWAKANLGADELRALNEAVQRKSMPLAKMALQGLNARHMAAVGREPKLVSGDNAPGSGGFTSQAEARRAIADPRYAKDPAYRQDVENRLRANPIFTSRTVG